MFHTIMAQAEFKVDSIQQFQYDEVLANLQLIQREHFTYDNGGAKQTESRRLLKQMGTWQNYQKTNLTYNINNDLITENHRDWDETNTLWLDIFKGDYEYDEF